MKNRQRRLAVIFLALFVFASMLTAVASVEHLGHACGEKCETCSILSRLQDVFRALVQLAALFTIVVAVTAYLRDGTCSLTSLSPVSLKIKLNN